MREPTAMGMYWETMGITWPINRDLDLSKNVLSPKIAILVENPSYPLSGFRFLGQTNMCIQHYNINMGKVIPKKNENSTRRTGACRLWSFKLPISNGQIFSEDSIFRLSCQFCNNSSRPSCFTSPLWASHSIRRRCPLLGLLDLKREYNGIS